jgi:predicted AlkP superfamily phosphohydrolase/phosphomutase
MRRVYQRIDEAIGRIMAEAGDATVIVFSAHGMSHWYGAQFLLPQILEKLGASVAIPRPALTVKRAAHLVLLAAWKALPPAIRRPVRALRRAVSGPEVAAVSKPVIPADVTRSRCFVHPNGLAVGGIRLNIAGREPDGLLQPGKEVEEFTTWLVQSLLEINDERTGKPVIERVRRTADLYDGEFLDTLPDLLVEWSDAVPTGSLGVANGVGARVRVSSPKIGIVEGDNDFSRTGEHRPGGWLAASGAGIAHGRFEQRPSLMDIAPTLTAMLGVTLPNSDGQPIEELLAMRRPSHEQGDTVAVGH